MNEFQISDIVLLYRTKRAEAAAIRDRHKKELAEVQGVIQHAEDYIHSHLKATGVKSVRTEHGTATITTRVSKSVEDWNELKQFVKENDCMDIMYKSVSNPAVKEWEEENDRTIPGLKVTQTQSLSVRAPAKKAKSLGDE